MLMMEIHSYLSIDSDLVYSCAVIFGVILPFCRGLGRVLWYGSYFPKWVRVYNSYAGFIDFAFEVEEIGAF
jgi:hypothetical protein